MTFDPSKPCRTADGRNVTLWDVRQGASYPGGPVIGVVHNPDGSSCLLTWHEGGRPAYTEMSEGCLLINIPEEHEVKVYFHRRTEDNCRGVEGSIYGINTNDTGNAVASKRIKFTEGEFEE